jgi:threonine dehydratase
MPLFTLAELESAAELVRRTVPPTPAHAWPLLAGRVGAEVWVKHENHTPIGAFKVRGGLVYMDALKRSGAPVAGVTSATRGNHGQSIALAARIAGLRSVIYVPHANSVEKNRAMRAFGATLVEHGGDFDESKEACADNARREGLHFVPSFHRDLVIGVATYALELFRAVPDIDTAFVPVGMGSGICGMITARDLLGLKTRIVGVVAGNAPCVALSFEAGRPVATNSARTFADGLACRVPNAEAIAIIAAGAERIVQVSEAGIAEAMRAYYSDTHNLVEGAGAAPLAALLGERDRHQGRRIAVVCSGGNVDASLYQTVLAGGTPAV